jgi:hypothetical protein
LRFTFAAGSLESFKILQICPYFAAEPLEITGGSQLGPPGRPTAVPTEIRRAGGAGWPGKVGRMTRDSPATGLGAWLESGSRRQGHTAAQPGSGRQEPCSGEAAARWEEGASWRATTSAREGGGHCSWARGRWNSSSPQQPCLAPADGTAGGWGVLRAKARSSGRFIGDARAS